MNKELAIAGELSEKLLETIISYSGKVSTIGVIGILEVIKVNIINDAQGN